jgi:hypothetical protein
MTLTQTNLSVDLPCDLGHGHWTRKFLVQLGLGRGEAKPVERRQPKGSTVVLNQPVPQSKPIRVTVEDSTLRNVVSGLALYQELWALRKLLSLWSIKLLGALG